ncbi:hypothetical protein CVT24_011048 [Panaeolus cyanescens]|uniref:Uncharacterized protein n=1 Tax=Panaeolus cyanescens TaxID=181874 RepID=A0A409VFW5_9AGAR|nr:hypothetical protein CVT24_011048 [Panaeolus cyanescens]
MSATPGEIHSPETDEVMPAEIFHLIFEFMAVDNEGFLEDMKACSLVAKSWVANCRPYLFREVELGPPSFYLPSESLNRSRRLAAILKDRPNTIYFIRKIKFTSFTSTDSDLEEVPNSFFSDLFGLSQAQILHIHVRNGQAPYRSGVQNFGWRSLLERYLLTKQLTDIILDGIKNVPLFSILSLPHLAALSISNCQILDTATADSSELSSGIQTLKLISVNFIETDGEVQVQTPFSFCFPKLINLQMERVYGLDQRLKMLEKTRAGMVFPAVESIQIHAPLERFPRFRTVQFLELEFEEYVFWTGWNEASQLLYDSMRYLTHICLQIRTEMQAEPGLNNLIDALSAVKGCNAIQTLELDIFEHVNDLDDWWDPCSRAWNALGDALSSDNDFPHLMKTSFHLDVCLVTCGESDENERAILAEKGFADAHSILYVPLGGLMFSPNMPAPDSPNHTVGSCNELPMELIDLIIGHLYDDIYNDEWHPPITDLKACSLVAKLWVPVCHSYLFQAIYIGSSISMDWYQRLAALIKQNQSIAKFIRKIRFRTVQGVPPTFDDADIASVESLDNPFPVISQMSEVRSLDIMKQGGRYQTGTAYVGWCYLLDWYLSTKQLTSISLTGIDEVPILSILLSPQLTTLNIADCRLAGVEESLSDLRSQHPPFTLENFTRLSASCFSRGFKGWDLSEETHCVADEPMAFPAVTSFKLRCPLGSKFPRFRTLQSLSLIYYTSNYTFDWSELSQFVNDSLRHLTHLHLEIHTEEDAEPILESIQEVLSPYKGVNVLRSFELKLYECGELENWWDTSSDAWTQLGNTLSSVSDFSSLRKVSIYLEIECEDDDDNLPDVLEVKGCPNVTSVLARPLEALVAREDVEVHYEVVITQVF